MAIDSSTTATTIDPSCSASACDTSGGDDEPRPAGDRKKEKTAGSETEVPCLKKLLRETPPEYLKLSLTHSSAQAAAKYRRWKQPEDVSLVEVDAPRDYLSLSVTPSDQRKRRRGRHVTSGGAGPVVADASSVASSGGAAERALVAVEAVIPPPPVQIPAACLNLAAAGVYQETAGEAGTSSASSSNCLALAIHCSPATMDPINAVPLQAVYVHGGVSCPLRLGSSTRQITTNDTAVAPPAAAGGQAKQVA